MVTGLLVPVEVAVAGVELSEVVVADSLGADSEDEAGVGSEVGSDEVVVVTLIVSVALVESLMRQESPSSAHSYPSGQHPRPHVGSAMEVSLECKGRSGNWFGSWKLVSHVITLIWSQLLSFGQQRAAACAPVLFSRRQTSLDEQQKLSGKSCPHAESPSLPAHVSRGKSAFKCMAFIASAEAVLASSAICMRASRLEGSRATCIVPDSTSRVRQL